MDNHRNKSLFFVESAANTKIECFIDKLHCIFFYLKDILSYKAF